MARYLKGDDGTVYLEGDNPIQMWSPEEWADYILQIENEVASLILQIAQAPQPKSVPDQECLDFWNSHMIGMMNQFQPFQQQLEYKQKELAEIMAV